MTMTHDKISWVASYPRSGNTWVRFLFGAYAHGVTSNWTVCNYAITDVHPFLAEGARKGWTPEEILNEIVGRFGSMKESIYRPRHLVLKTHFKWTDQHPFRARTHKVIHLIRHPKDVLLSALNFHEVVKAKNLPPEPEAARRFIETGGDPTWLRVRYGTWFEHYESWRTNTAYPRLLVRYEDLKRDTLGEFLRMVEFMDLPVDEARARRAVEQTTLEQMRRLEMEARAKKRFFDAKKGRYFVHKGSSGQSLRHLGEDLDDAFDERFAPWLEATGYAPA